MTNALSTILTENHNKVSETFINKVIALLEMSEKSIESYGVNTRWGDEELITIKVNGGKLNITHTANRD